MIGQIIVQTLLHCKEFDSLSRVLLIFEWQIINQKSKNFYRKSWQYGGNTNLPAGFNYNFSLYILVSLYSSILAFL